MMLRAAVVRLACLTLSLAALASAAPAQAPSDLPHPFVRLSEIAPDIQQHMRYATTDNFLGRKVAGYEAGVCILTRPTAEALARVQARLGARGYSLKVYDCYRPARAVRDFIHWSRNEPPGKTQQQYFKGLEHRNLFKLGYISSRSMHSRGNTVDLSVVPLNGEAPSSRKDLFCGLTDKTTLDFGTGYDCFNDKSHTASPEISEDAQKNRRMLVAAMKAEGFKNYSKEWWHFELAGAAVPEAFDFPVRERRVKQQADSAEKPLAGAPECPHSLHESKLYSVDCHGKTIDIKVLKSPSRSAEPYDKSIVDYDPEHLEACACSTATGAPSGEKKWCRIRYISTIEQEFEDGWVLLSALQTPKDGRRTANLAKCN